ncbi:hypothetical protein N7499_012231 [Penicillium canescens]|uniref:uncharacterized protein n=1 Tax=Penicillium canescens TaxID=5083 RepID=UPI0026DFD29A|nr:uncharacterized protein N7446_001123 [Penicillium canescens]KAJ6063551.1 hypothetical protein N7499_012231 [Penicillium canescens]KAJ6078187.1 hypothetical protein N7446_001123 [Penicillium canescens]KAJ6154955.1 hypothetical protein N7485_013324 [Penicillium canescens]
MALLSKPEPIRATSRAAAESGALTLIAGVFVLSYGHTNFLAVLSLRDGGLAFSRTLCSSDSWRWLLQQSYNTTAPSPLATLRGLGFPTSSVHFLWVFSIILAEWNSIAVQRYILRSCFRHHYVCVLRPFKSTE